MNPVNWLRLAAFIAVGATAGATPLAAQDTTVRIIRPEARPDSSRGGPLPSEVLQELLSAYNDSLTTRIAGSFLVPAGTKLIGPIAVFRGTLRVSGELEGRIVVINGYLIVDPGAHVSGDVLVVGGGIDVRPEGRIEGRRRIYPQRALLVRTGDGRLAIREPSRPLGDLASARTSFTTGHFKTTLSIETGRTYNRVEGLPIVFGPSVVREGLPNVEGRLDLRGIAWTAPDRTDRRANFGYSGRLEFRFGQSRRLTVGSQVYRFIAPIEEQPLSRTEAGWSSFFFQRDYRDYYQATGVSGYLSYHLGHGLTLETSLRSDAERSVPANDPISIFRNDAWRPNPLVDDGRYASWRVGAHLDTRNDPTSPTSGWLVQMLWERSQSDDAAPLSLAPEVRDPIAPGRYAFSRFGIDARRYVRFDPAVRGAIRFVAGGWLNGDPLPVQRRLSLGGSDFLPGYGFRSQSCGAGSLTDPAHPALCDRMMAVQVEVRTRTRMGLPIPTTDPYLTALQRLFGIREPDVVILGDAGKSWITGEGPGRVPNDRIPVLREWEGDLGFGFDAGGIGLYLVQPLTEGRPLMFSVRLQRRF